MQAIARGACRRLPLLLAELKTAGEACSSSGRSSGALSGEIARSFSSSAAQLRGIEVEVKNNSVDKALRDLKRKLIDDGVAKTWQKQEFHIKATDRRRISESATESRMQKANFGAKLRWIMRRRQKDTL